MESFCSPYNRYGEADPVSLYPFVPPAVKLDTKFFCSMIKRIAPGIPPSIAQAAKVVVLAPMPSSSRLCRPIGSGYDFGVLKITDDITTSPSGPVKPCIATTAIIGLDNGIITCQKILVLLAP